MTSKCVMSAAMMTAWRMLHRMKMQTMASRVYTRCCRGQAGYGHFVLTNTYLVMIRVVVMKRFVLSIISDQTQQLHIGEAYDEDRECNSQGISLNIQISD